MKTFRLGLGLIVLSATAFAQLTLTGSSYIQDFNSVGIGLPAGWSVHVSAPSDDYGSSTTFNSAITDWSTGSGGGAFRNVASNNIAVSSNSVGQSADTNRALGWRPVGTSSAQVTPFRTGAVMFSIANTIGLKDFGLSVTVFTANNVQGDQRYQLEYRIGNLGQFQSLGVYNTGLDGTGDFHTYTFMEGATMLASWSDQASPLYIRFRGISTAGSSNLDVFGIDDFSITYAAVPEPTQCALLCGVVGLIGLFLYRRNSAYGLRQNNSSISARGTR